MNPLAFRRSLQEAWGYTAEVSEYRKSSHAVYRLRYHFVFITKYRKPALRGEIGKEVRDLTREICRSLDIEIVKETAVPASIFSETELATLHALRRFLFFAHEGKVQRRQADQQTNQILCLNLVTNAPSSPGTPST